MKHLYSWRIALFSILLVQFSLSGTAQTNGVTTYMNPIMGDHPDQTLMRVGDDFYSAGSSFHYNPFIPILHSTDLVHWEIIARVVPSNWAGLSSGDPGAGTWQGALAQFGGYFWLYFSNHTSGGQYFCKATSMAGPWSAPTRVTGANVTGYDNSIFVDDDGTPYMVMKNGANLNQILKLDKTTGNSTGTVMDMNWLNPSPTNTYHMAEGPVMCKRNGRYYYFFAGDVYGGQWVISSATLTGAKSAWTAPAVFFTGTTTLSGFTAPNHMSQPIKLDDGTWWCITHGYGLDGWRGQGRICTLHQVTWDANGVPHSANASSNPVTAPNLPNPNNIAFNAPREDYFTSTTLKYHWFFWNRANATKYSLTANPGYMRLTPGTGTTHILQQEAGRVYSMVTKVTVSATASGQRAGLRIQNGNDDSYVCMYAGNSGSAKIGLSYNATTTEIANTIGNTVWLRIDRDQHNIKGFYSADGKTWTQVGGAISVTALDDFATDYNKWVGNTVGLFATAVTADFDLYKFKDGLSPLKVSGYNNFNGVSTASKTPGSVVTNTADGGWAVLQGVSMGDGTLGSTSVEVNAASASGSGSLEVWIDNIGGAGTKLATIPVTASGGADVWKNYAASITATGQHDVYLKFVGAAGTFSVNTVKFVTGVSDAPAVTFTAPAATEIITTGTPVTLTVTAAPVAGATIAKVDFYNGTTLIKSVTASPYTVSWTPAASGTSTISATATDSKGKTGTASMSVTVHVPQTPYGGTAKPIPGTVQFEEYDEGGNGNAYFDNTPGSEVTPVVTFRTAEDVDIEACSDAGAGYNIGFGTAGEWLEYTVNVAAAGLYNITLRAACNADDRTVSLQANGVDIAKDVAIPNTAGWQTWVDVPVNNISLEAGVQVIRLTIGASDYINLNYMTISAVAQPAPPISLSLGWNLIGYPYEGSPDIATALSSVWDNTLAVKNADSFYDKSADPMFNKLTKLNWGAGYFIKVDAPCTLIWK